MFTQFFGQFLLNNDLIKADELNIVFQNIKNTRLRLGMIAINEGYLNAKQVTEINNLQKHHDKKFGEIAIDFNYLTKAELDLILSKQQSEHLILAQTVVNLGYMTMEDFAEAMNVYKRHHGISDESFDELKNGKIDEVIYNMLEVEDEEIKAYVTLFYKNIIRFITNDVYISQSVKLNEDETYKYIFEQEIFGNKALYTAFTAEEKVLIPFSQKYAGEPIVLIDEFTIDVCKEFLNLHNGLFAVNMSDQNKEFNLKIQTHKENHTPVGEKLYRIPFHTGLGDIQLIIGK